MLQSIAIFCFRFEVNLKFNITKFFLSIPSIQMSDRRSFLKNTLLTSSGLLILPLLSFDDEANAESAKSDFYKGFSMPPHSARPQAFWMWMNGHITHEGITLDLERMKEMGLSGAFIYNTGTNIPKGPVAYGSEQWEALVAHALKEANRLGLELLLHNSPGFSSTGGAKVTPEISMQQLAWTEMVVESNGAIAVQLPQPATKHDYYRDSVVIAYPSLAAEKHDMHKTLASVSVNGKEVQKSFLRNDNEDTGIELRAPEGAKAVLQLEFSEPFEARSITVKRLREPSSLVYDLAYDHPPFFVLESSSDGVKYQPVCTINMPMLRFINAPGAQSFPAVKAKFFRLSTAQKTTLTNLQLHAGPRLQGWPGKANFTDNIGGEDNQVIDESFIINPDRVIDLTGKLNKDGRLVWDAPVGTWTILRFGHTATGTQTVATPDDAGGLEIDKFSADAVDAYFRLYLDDLISKLKPFPSFKGLLIDSWEIGKQNWTAAFPSFFQHQNGYAIASFMPALTGRIVQSVSTTEKFLWDVRCTQADMVAANYYGRFKKRCALQGLQFYAQPNGDGVFDSLQVGQHLNVPMAEFWTRYMPGTLNLVQQAVSIAHGYGSKIIAAEAYTGIPAFSRWTEYPYALKSQGDYMYSMGINRFVLHVFVHQPYTTGFPGMSMGAWGSHFDRNMTWHKGAKEWIRYLARTQYLLQQGLPVADICYFKGEEPLSGIPDVDHTDPPVPKSLKGDVIGPDVLMNRIRIVSNKLVLPDGMQYRLMILAPLKKVSPHILLQIKQLVERGMMLIVSAKPEDTPGITSSGKSIAAVKRLANDLWGNLDGIAVKERKFGAGKIYWNKPLHEILQEHNIAPDFEFTANSPDAAIHYTHRQAGETDLYFISNHLRRKESLLCHFRVQGKYPEIWNSETGEITKAALYSGGKDGDYVPLELSPSGSLFVLFRKPQDQKPYSTISRNGALLISAKPLRSVPEKPYQDVADNFTISLWIKPDIPAEHPKGILVFPPEAAVLYGDGHAACGLSAGQNGVRVYEREKGPNRNARLQIYVQQALAGWTHLALRYKNRKPSIFINGRLAGEGTAATKFVHPGMGTPPTGELFSALFEGAFTSPKLIKEPLPAEMIYRLYQQGLPPPELPSPITVTQHSDGTLSANIWQDGDYLIEGGLEAKKIKIKNCKIVPVDVPWKVSFPLQSGAPSIRLKKLASLHEHAHFDVKHFSGTATWTALFSFSEQLLKEQRVLLHLGRVEVVAEVTLNGKDLGVLWKEPFSLDVTDDLRSGTNKLIVNVTNLWPNRMIGDAYLPAENSYDENNFLTRLPPWYVASRPKPGSRKTFSVWNNFTKNDPLLAAGLLGPVQLIVGWGKAIT